MNLNEVKYVQKVPEATAPDGGERETVCGQAPVGRQLAYLVWLNRVTVC